jgi:hypothetical protein
MRRRTGISPYCTICEENLMDTHRLSHSPEAVFHAAGDDDVNINAMRNVLGRTIEVVSCLVPFKDTW